MESFDYSKLRGRLAEIGMSQECLAKKIGVTSASLSNKLKNKSDFKQREMRSILEIIGVPLEEGWKYFFT